MEKINHKIRMKVKQIPKEMELILVDGRRIVYKRVNDGSWQDITDKVKKDRHWGRFLVFEEIKPDKLITK